MHSYFKPFILSGKVLINNDNISDNPTQPELKILCPVELTFPHKQKVITIEVDNEAHTKLKTANKLLYMLSYKATLKTIEPQKSETTAPIVQTAKLSIVL